MNRKWKPCREHQKIVSALQNVDRPAWWRAKTRENSCEHTWHRATVFIFLRSGVGIFWNADDRQEYLWHAWTSRFHIFCRIKFFWLFYISNIKWNTGVNICDTWPRRVKGVAIWTSSKFIVWGTSYRFKNTYNIYYLISSNNNIFVCTNCQTDEICRWMSYYRTDFYSLRYP